MNFDFMMECEIKDPKIKAAYDELSMSVVNLKLKADKAALEAAYNLAVRMTESEEYDAESLK